MNSPPRRTQPSRPDRPQFGPRPNQYQYQQPPSPSNNIYSYNNLYFNSYAFPPHASRPPDIYEEPQTSSIPVGTILHKGFYDLLAMIPTPSPSRLLWRAPAPPSPEQSILAGPRYEDLPTNVIKSSPKKGRRVSKDMVSKPTGFV